MPPGSPFRAPGPAGFGVVLPPGGRLERTRAPPGGVKWLLRPAAHLLPPRSGNAGCAVPSRLEHRARPGLVQRKAAVGHAPCCAAVTACGEGELRGLKYRRGFVVR